MGDMGVIRKMNDALDASQGDDELIALQKVNDALSAAFLDRPRVLIRVPCVTGPGCLEIAVTGRLELGAADWQYLKRIVDVAATAMANDSTTGAADE